MAKRPPPPPPKKSEVKRIQSLASPPPKPKSEVRTGGVMPEKKRERSR